MFAEMISNTQLTEINKPIQLRYPALPRITENCNKFCFPFHEVEGIGIVLFIVQRTLSIAVVEFECL